MGSTRLRLLLKAARSETPSVTVMFIGDYFAGSHLLELMTRYLHLGWDSPNTYIPKICTCVCCSVFCWYCIVPLLLRHNGRDGVSNHRPHHCLLNRLFRRRSKKTSKLHVTGLCAGNSPVNSQHKWPVTRKMFPFDDVIMSSTHYFQDYFTCTKAIVWLPQNRWKWSIPGTHFTNMDEP